MLNRDCAREFTDPRKQIGALPPVVPEHLDFYEFVCLETALDFGHDAVGQACAADCHDWIECMRARPEEAAIGSGFLIHRAHCSGLNPATSAGSVRTGRIFRHRGQGL